MNGTVACHDRMHIFISGTLSFESKVIIIIYIGDTIVGAPVQVVGHACLEQTRLEEIISFVERNHALLILDRVRYGLGTGAARRVVETRIVEITAVAKFVALIMFGRTSRRGRSRRNRACKVFFVGFVAVFIRDL